ncbi:hypothetical protein BSK48_20165 [Paenibacillus odorifer]|nr:hypothetical protein BSK48_20165 [Paenibacillus odorifer]OMD78613.1 hypothetical protein BSK53_23345 [Paenibacillus odorifer]
MKNLFNPFALFRLQSNLLFQGYIFIGIFLLSLLVLMLVTILSRAYQEVKEEVLIQDLILKKI